MARVILIHWNAAEAAERLAVLRKTGHDAAVFTPGSGEGLRGFRANPPDAFVIDLGRLPSQGGAVAIFLRQQKATRQVPIVFAGGDPEKVARVQKTLPDALYTEWRQMPACLRRALRQPAANPLVPGTMDGYSGTPLPKKLGIRADSMVALLGAPEGFAQTLGALPDNVRLQKQARAGAHRILLFVKSRADLAKRFPAAAGAMAEGGGLWIVWPKRASGVVTDLGEAHVRSFGLAAGFVDYKICAVDQTWSGLLFARRR
jgi:CheY-like chemotaxis protein